MVGRFLKSHAMARCCSGCGETTWRWRACRRRLFSSQNNSSFLVSPAVLEAVRLKEPIVALESTIITHGMPYPQNLRMALEVEEIVRTEGATPATIAVLEGSIHVGLSQNQITHLAANAQTSVKLARRDLPNAVVKGLTGGTTVSATIHAAHLAGVSLLATGGLGGVHRGANQSMDVSADLVELSRTPVTVVSSGVKSILDIGLTLEYLETLGVPVATYGPTADFPAFFRARSGFPAPYRVGSAEEAAGLVRAVQSVGISGGTLVGVPIPDEFAGAGEEIDAATELALSEARDKKITGSAVTPYILGRIHELTGNASLEANIALVKNNAHVGACIAIALSKLDKNSNGGKSQKVSVFTMPSNTITDNCEAEPTSAFKRSSAPTSSSVYASVSQFGAERKGKRPVVVGGTNFDHVLKAEEPIESLIGATHRSSVSYSPGGVGRNIADGLTRLGANPVLLSAIGEEDVFAENILHSCSHMDWSRVRRVHGEQTSVYFLVMGHEGEMLLGLQNMKINEKISADYIRSHRDALASAPFVVFDGNIPISSMKAITQICSEANVPVFFEPTDVRKAAALVANKLESAVAFVKPNLIELVSMMSSLSGQQQFDLEENSDTTDLPLLLQTVSEASKTLCERLPYVLVTLGEQGVLVCADKEKQAMEFTGGTVINDSARFQSIHYPALTINQSIVNTSGAGDSFSSGFLCGVWRGMSGEQCIQLGQECSRLSLLSHSAISTDLNSLRPT